MDVGDKNGTVRNYKIARKNMTPIYINYTTIRERRQVQITSFGKYFNNLEEKQTAAGETGRRFVILP